MFRLCKTGRCRMRIRPDQLDKRCGCKYCGQIKPAYQMKKKNLAADVVYVYPQCLDCAADLYYTATPGRAVAIQHELDKQNVASALTYSQEYHCHGCGVVYAEICQCHKCGTYLTEIDGYTREKLLV